MPQDSATTEVDTSVAPSVNDNGALRDNGEVESNSIGCLSQYTSRAWWYRFTMAENLLLLVEKILSTVQWCLSGALARTYAAK